MGSLQLSFAPPPDPTSSYATSQDLLFSTQSNDNYKCDVFRERRPMLRDNANIPSKSFASFRSRPVIGSGLKRIAVK